MSSQYAHCPPPYPNKTMHSRSPHSYRRDANELSNEYVRHHVYVYVCTIGDACTPNVMQDPMHSVTYRQP